MIIYLTGADFSTNKIGTINTWSIFTSLGRGATYSGPTYVDKNAELTATVTIADGYEIGSAGISLMVGSADMTDGCTNISGNTITISIGSVTGNVTIKVPTVNTSTGEEDSGNNDSVTPNVVVYTSRQSSSGISKSSGEYLSSTAGYVNIYENIDPTKEYAATGYAPASTGDNACVCYYTSDGTFISGESGSDWGISSVEYTMQELTVPSNASTIKLFGRTNNQASVLYLTSTISLSEISYSSQQTSSNLNKTTGEYGSSSTGYINIYDNIDASKTYYGSGFCPNASGTAAAVCYYTSDGTFISAQDGNDFGVSSDGFVKQKLTVPSTTSTIKIFAQSASAYPNEPSAALYVEQ